MEHDSEPGTPPPKSRFPDDSFGTPPRPEAPAALGQRRAGGSSQRPERDGLLGPDVCFEVDAARLREALAARHVEAQAAARASRLDESRRQAAEARRLQEARGESKGSVTGASPRRPRGGCLRTPRVFLHELQRPQASPRGGEGIDAENQFLWHARRQRRMNEMSTSAATSRPLPRNLDCQEELKVEEEALSGRRPREQYPRARVPWEAAASSGATQQRPELQLPDKMEDAVARIRGLLDPLRPTCSVAQGAALTHGLPSVAVAALRALRQAGALSAKRPAARVLIGQLLFLALDGAALNADFARACVEAGMVFEIEQGLLHDIKAAETPEEEQACWLRDLSYQVIRLLSNDGGPAWLPRLSRRDGIEYFEICSEPEGRSTDHEDDWNW
eukprot:TRINITY_DN36662_c0_g1_i1.p1 TRINITY_DN36662_c0_g1~~TRINITY_DN36662_c0_g1_i1.p1  ORF type:complete len:418 (+),score=76.87 TRINITY_DN36662_c0_g1_i1:88-1254(+)